LMSIPDGMGGDKMENRVNDVEPPKEILEEEAVFAVEEITIEEMAIDGICGVY
jgi:mycofactocin precursor